MCGFEALDPAIVERQRPVADRLDQEQPLQLAQLLGILGGDVVGLGPVVRCVELPDVVVDRRQLGADHPRDAVTGRRGPALVVDAAVDEHLEVLGLAVLGRLGVGEARQHALAVQRHLLDAVDEGRVRQAGGVEDGRGDVDHVAELAADLALGLDPGGQWTIVPLRVPPQWEPTCLVHL